MSLVGVSFGHGYTAINQAKANQVRFSGEGNKLQKTEVNFWDTLSNATTSAQNLGHDQYYMKASDENSKHPSFAVPKVELKDEPDSIMVKMGHGVTVVYDRV